MKLFRFFLLFCAIASFAAETQLPSSPSLTEKNKVLETAVMTADDLKSNEAAWNDSFLRYSRQVKRDMEVVGENAVLFQKLCTQILEKAVACENQVKYYYNCMMQYDRYDALKITLYSEKISQKTREFKILKSRFTDFTERIAEIKQRYNNLASGQAMIKEDLLPEDLRRLLKENHENTLILHQKLTEWQKLMDQEQTRLNKIGNTIHELDERSSQRQNEVISTIFFDNQSSFPAILPESAFILKYWGGEMNDAWNLHWNQLKQLNRSFLLNAVFLFFLQVIAASLFYYKVLRKKIEDKLPAVFARRKQFFFSFLLLFAASSLYWSALKELNADTNLIRQLTLTFIFLAGLKIALALRMSRLEQKEVLPLYRVSMVVYFISITCSLFMISYNPLVLFSTVTSAGGSLATLWILRKQRTWHTPDRIFGFCMLADFMVATLLGFYGFAYMSLTMMMSWFVIVTLMETIFGISHFLRALSNAEEKPGLIYQILRRFIIPLCWVGLLFYLVRWLAQTFHLEEKIFYFLNYQIIGKSGDSIYINFTPWELTIMILVGIMLYLGINCLKILLENLAEDSMRFGLLPSSMILGTYLLWASYIVFVLAMFKVQYSSILVILGGMSFGLGFGLKEIIENFLAGLILLVGQQIRPGDIVEVASDNTLGKVKKLTVRSTVVETYDGAIVAYPNALVLTKDFRNWTSNNQFRRRELSVGVAYDSNLDQVCRILLETTRATGGVLNHPAPEILCKGFGDSSVDFEIRFWGHVNTSYQTASDLRCNIYKAFKEAGISIPFPQMDLHMAEPQG